MYFEGSYGEALVIALDLAGFAGFRTARMLFRRQLPRPTVLTAIGAAAERARSSPAFSRWP